MRGFIVGTLVGFLGLVVLWGMSIQITWQVMVIFTVGMLSGAIAGTIVMALNMSKKR